MCDWDFFIRDISMRESMAFDIVIVGAAPAGLSAACRLIQQAHAEEQLFLLTNESKKK